MKSFKEYYEGGDIPWLMSGEVGQGEITETTNYITRSGLENSSARLFPPNTLLVAMYGATAGQVGILRFEASTNQAVCGILPSDKFLPEFLYYFFLFKKDELVAQAAGNAQPNISQIKIKNTGVPTAPLPEQRRIVAILDEAFEGIATAKANAEKNLQNAREVFESHLNAVFSQRGEGWVEKPISECFKIRNGDFLPSKSMVQSGEYDVYGGNGINGKHNQKNISGCNIIIGRVGAKCGNVRFVNGDLWVTDNAFYISRFIVDVDKHLLAMILKRKDLRTTANHAAQPVISYSTIKDVVIEFPAEAYEQRRIVESIMIMEVETQHLESLYQQKLTALDELKQSLLHQAFNGDL
ncbi:restriction endonuclease subunit S [Acidithiobacillus ferrooxidans]|uniref:restriction endonuclease subunit S n=1 Tax=Acidithiobacillus ferrooxidans TaxID=920 RepID=UPI000A820115